MRGLQTPRNAVELTLGDSPLQSVVWAHCFGDLDVPEALFRCSLRTDPWDLCGADPPNDLDFPLKRLGELDARFQSGPVLDQRVPTLRHRCLQSAAVFCILQTQNKATVPNGHPLVQQMTCRTHWADILLAKERGQRLHRMGSLFQADVPPEGDLVVRKCFISNISIITKLRRATSTLVT